MGPHHTGTTPKPKSGHQGMMCKPQPHWGDLIPEASTQHLAQEPFWRMCGEVTKPHKPGSKAEGTHCLLGTTRDAIWVSPVAGHPRASSP